MLSLYVVSNISLFVDSSDDESPAWSPAVLLGEECEIKLVLLHLESLDVCVAVDAGNLEGRILLIFEGFQHVVIERKVGDVVSAVWVGSQQVLATGASAASGSGGKAVFGDCLSHVSLDGLGQVQLVRVIKGLVFLDI